MKYFVSILLTLSLYCAYAQTAGRTVVPPEVYLIGEHESTYPEIALRHPGVFMSLYDYDLDDAYRGWCDLLMDIEDYAETLDFDLKGTKLWINLYFNPDGTIEHLAYFPKPNSRNIPPEHLTAFFKSFVRQYQFKRTSDKGFQHSASASFPTFFHRTTVQTNKGN